MDGAEHSEEKWDMIIAHPLAHISATQELADFIPKKDNSIKNGTKKDWQQRLS